jgi:hypothetical protein
VRALEPYESIPCLAVLATSVASFLNTSSLLGYPVRRYTPRQETASEEIYTSDRKCPQTGESFLYEEICPQTGNELRCRTLMLW